jgi:exonuclease III
MIGASLNCRGVGKKGMSVFLQDIIKSQMLDFVGLQETIKKDYSQAFFRRIDPLSQFCWKWSPSVGRSGGILGGFKLDRFKVCDTIVNRFFIKVKLFDIKIQQSWSMVIVYGAAQEEDKEDFLRELGEVCRDQSFPLLIGGDFNLLRGADDKNKTLRPNKWNDMFNYIINTCELRELELSGGQFTWSNNHAVPTLEKLDRFLISKEWEVLFPLTTVHKLVREVSDHNPIILDTMENREQRSREFRFHKRWLKEENFIVRVSRIWAKPVWAKDSLDLFIKKLKNVKKISQRLGC